MKFTLAALLFITSNLFAQVEHFAIIANEGDFAVISDIEAPEAEVFLSYSGRRANHCGITLRGSSLNISTQELVKVLEISNETAVDVAVVKNGRLEARVSHPEADRYGESFTIKTRNGSTLTCDFHQRRECF